MKTATISDTKNRLSYYIDQVRHGETIIILDRDKPVARLESILSSPESAENGRLERLVRAGLVRPPIKKLSAAFLKSRPLKPKQPANLVQAVIEDREDRI